MKSTKEYKIFGPSENLSAGPVKCNVCGGGGQRIASQGSTPEKCGRCDGTGSFLGLMGQVNEAAADGWVYAGSHAVGFPAINHVFIMERDVEVDQAEAAEQK